MDGRTERPQAPTGDVARMKWVSKYKSAEMFRKKHADELQSSKVACEKKSEFCHGRPHGFEFSKRANVVSSCDPNYGHVLFHAGR